MSMEHNGAGWLRQCYVREAIDEAVGKAEHQLKRVDFDTIAFRGASGALFAPIVAYLLKKEIFYARKGDGSHSYTDFEGCVSSKKYIILDDFTSSGDTVFEIFKKMKRENPFSELVGFYFYHAAGVNDYGTGFSGPDSECFKELMKDIERRTL